MAKEKKIDYASMYTLRKDGRYQGSYTDKTGRTGIRNGSGTS